MYTEIWNLSKLSANLILVLNVYTFNKGHQIYEFVISFFLFELYCFYFKLL